MKPSSYRLAGRKAFTLVELAIIMGIIGIVSAAIWATASVVRARHPIHDTVQIVSEIAMNVRGVYTGFPSAPAPNLTTQINRGMFPLGIVTTDNTDTINAWGGTVRLTFPAAVPMNGFSIEFTLPNTIKAVDRREACLGMVTRLQGTATINPATGTAWSTSGTLPTGGVPARDPTQGGGPSLVFIKSTSSEWKNVTGVAAGSLFGASATDECYGFAYYYRL